MTHPDLLNVTLNYWEDDHTHRDTFTHLEGVTWDISTCLIVPEEVVKHIKLAPEQNEWCLRRAAPHVSLPSHAGHT